jgi:two-component system, sensor histidine kinase and response regulator
MNKHPHIHDEVQLLRRALEMSADIVCITNAEGLIVYVNGSFLRKFGYEREDLLGKRIQFFDFYILQEGERFLASEDSGTAGWRGETSARKKDGGMFKVYLALMPVFDVAGKTLGLISQARPVLPHQEALSQIRSLASDLEQNVMVRTAEVVTQKDDLVHINQHLGDLIRQLDEAKQKAELANKVKSQFLAHVSHEMRTPLNSVIGFANLLSKNKEANLSEHDLFYLNRIIGNAAHLLNVIGQMLDLSMIESGKLSLNLTEVSLSELIRETIADLRGHAHADSVAMIADIPKGAQTIETDRQKLKQVLINLLGNALKFTEKGGISVRVVVDVLRRPIRIEVSDTGIGIPKDRLESVFEAFERGHDRGEADVEGTGLGLTISRSLCSAMGYELGVESEVGKGSTFMIHMVSRIAEPRT